jgi:hypothetical protein
MSRYDDAKLESLYAGTNYGRHAGAILSAIDRKRTVNRLGSDLGTFFRSHGMSILKGALEADAYRNGLFGPETDPSYQLSAVWRAFERLDEESDFDIENALNQWLDRER